MENVKPVKPISPSEAVDANQLPYWVIEGANECIVENLNGTTSHFTQDELIKHIMRYAPDGTTRNRLFDKHYLDIEDVYRKEGWEVEYDQPAYCENYPANFTFKTK